VDNKNKDIFNQLKIQTERIWENITIKPHIYGFQIQAGTKWRPGLSQPEIDKFEQDIGFKFPQIYRDYLSCMNGTDKDTLDIHGSTAMEPTYDCGYYSYPQDLERIKKRISWIYEAFDTDENFVQARKIPHIMPIYSHRFLIVDNFIENPVLSMHGTDVIIYGDDLLTYLARENDIDYVWGEPKKLTEDIVSFWLEDH
jgi:hypothetical protein